MLITREYADTLAGKTPAPYFRTHDPIQRRLVDEAAQNHSGRPSDTAYLNRMIHFWREVSLAGLPLGGKAMDECFTLVFQSAFDLAEAESEWAAEVLYDKTPAQWSLRAANDLWARTPAELTHDNLRYAITTIYAPLREDDPKWHDEDAVTSLSEVWFWAGLACGAGIDENHRLWRLRVALGESAEKGWHDTRLHTQVIRSAPLRGVKTPKHQLMEHPLIRYVRVRYPNNPVEQGLMARFFNMRCIEAGFESEEDAFSDPLRLAQWIRDARTWAEQVIQHEPETYAALRLEAGDQPLQGCRDLYQRILDDVRGDSIDITIGLINWAKRKRGFDVSWYRAQLWEFIVEVVDAALWLGWTYPRSKATA